MILFNLGNIEIHISHDASLRIYSHEESIIGVSGGIQVVENSVIWGWPLGIAFFQTKDLKNRAEQNSYHVIDLQFRSRSLTKRETDVILSEITQHSVCAGEKISIMVIGAAPPADKPSVAKYVAACFAHIHHRLHLHLLFILGIDLGIPVGHFSDPDLLAVLLEPVELRGQSIVIPMEGEKVNLRIFSPIGCFISRVERIEPYHRIILSRQGAAVHRRTDDVKCMPVRRHIEDHMLVHQPIRRRLCGSAICLVGKILDFRIDLPPKK
jgi:hypothetical protein